MKRFSALVLFSLLWISLPVAFGQRSKQKVFFSDIDNFWVAYDSIRTTSDSLRQLQYLHRLYIAKGTPGLKAFMETKGYTAEQYVSAIRSYPKFWNSIRPRTQLAKTSAPGMEPYLKKFKSLYPALRPADIYFTVGALRSNGTTKDSLVIIGVEMVTGTPETDISGFPPNQRAFFTRYFKSLPFENITHLNVHEYVHTQKNGYGNTLLGQAFYEGTCDLVAELIMKKPVPLPYRTYGPQHEQELKEKFKVQMFVPYYQNWFYNQVSDDPNHVPDLGYYMGYAICKSYYDQAKNKKQTVRELIELDCTNDEAVEAFLKKTRYFTEPINKAQLLQAYKNSRPTVIAVTPPISNDGYLDASVKEIRVEFSRAMGRTTNTDFGPGGKEQWPLVGKSNFAADKQSITYPVALKPGQTYQFNVIGSITEGGFRSADGFPLKPYEVKFKTRNSLFLSLNSALPSNLPPGSKLGLIEGLAGNRAVVQNAVILPPAPAGRATLEQFRSHRTA